MRTETRRLFEGYTQQVATLNNVSGVANTFSVEPTVQQSLEARMQESSTFLQAINMVGVNELKGQKVGVGITGTIAAHRHQRRWRAQPVRSDLAGVQHLRVPEDRL